MRRTGGPAGRGAVLALSFAFGPSVLFAQGDCFPGPESNEAKTFAIFSVPLAYSALSEPELKTRKDPWKISLEVSSIPNVDEETRTPTTCRPGKGPENTDLLPVVIRPRFSAPIATNLLFDISWIPPVRINGVKANILSLALSWNTAIGSKLTFGARAHSAFGEINGPITCPEEALDDPASECFEGTESDDSFKPNIFGADVRLGLGTAESKVHPYAGLGYNRLAPRFQVNFTNSEGELDNRKVEVDLNRIAVFGGLTWKLGQKVGLAGEIYSTPADAVTLRLALAGMF